MDIVERLRHHKSSDVWTERKNRTWYETDDLCMEAADEIERLREALREIVEAWDFWQSQETRSGFSELFANICEARAALAGEKKDG